MSETNSCREYLAAYCLGDNGCDLGFGGFRPIVDNAICVDRSKEFSEWPLHLFLDLSNLPFKDNSLAWNFSSHALEDFEDTTATIKEWVRVLKPGGNLVLFLPDQAAYEAHCAANGSSPNMGHKHKNFSLEFVKNRLPSNVKVIFEQWPVPYNPYSFALVVQKL